MADATRRVSVRLSLDDAARVKQELREAGQSPERSRGFLSVPKSDSWQTLS
jgi:hypothetical protein